jgi:hypothetical protein
MLLTAIFLLLKTKETVKVSVEGQNFSKVTLVPIETFTFTESFTYSTGIRSSANLPTQLDLDFGRPEYIPSDEELVSPFGFPVGQI